MAYYFDLINPFTINVANVYLNFVWLIDPILAFVIFLSVSTWVFKKKYEGREGKIIGVAVALALTFGFIVFEQRSGFFFGQLQGLAALLLMLIFGVFIYKLLENLFGDKHKACAFAIAYVLIYGIFMTVTQPSFHDLMYGYPLVAAILNIGFIAAFIKTVMCVFGMFSGGGDDKDPHAPAAEHPQGDDDKHDGPHQKLTVSYASPKFKQVFEAGQQIPVQASISGGKGGKYIWNVHGTFDERNIVTPSGSGAAVATLVNPLPTADYVITVSAYDGEKWEMAQTQFSVGHGKPDLNTTLSRASKFMQDVTKFRAAVEGFANAQGQLLATNAELAHGQVPAVSLADATTMYTRLSQLVDASQRELIDGLHALTSDAHYADMPAELAQRLGTAYAEYAVAAILLENNHRRFQDFFNVNGVGPLQLTVNTVTHPASGHEAAPPPPATQGPAAAHDAAEHHG